MDRSTVRATLAVLVTLGMSFHQRDPYVGRGFSRAVVFAEVAPRADGLVLSEVLFDPPAGARPFVELLNAGAAPVDLSSLDRPDNFEDDGSSYEFRRTEQLTIASPGCTMLSRTWATGAGTFTGDNATIGATIGDRPETPGAAPPARSARREQELAIGADGPGRGHAVSDLCVQSDQGPIEASFSLPECPGRQDPKDPRTFRFNCSAPIDPTPNPNVRILIWNVTGTVKLPGRAP